MTETLFKLSIPNTHQQYLHVELLLKNINNDIDILLPTWRPGRYEEGNFAKNIKGFKVFDDENIALDFIKTSKHSWHVNSKQAKNLRIQYQYYAAELNAGSTFVEKEMLYVNPVNCLMYVKERMGDKVQIDFEIPKTWEIAGSLTQINETSFTVESFDELFDTPVICSPNLICKSYQTSGYHFHLWFNDLNGIKWEKLITDFKKFTKKQIEDFGEFPCKEFHFLFHTPNNLAYHGVEHLKSTVIALGPKYDVFGKLYSELLGVSSHELYHVWNVKTIRPKEMMPYYFGLENYSKMGYVYEGVTTYMGDLYLLKSGVFTLNEYLKELEKQFQKHFDNYGRFNHAVSESSFDTWLDGYVKGAPGRKVSIYVEGCLLAFITDYMLRKATNNKIGIEGVMKRMYYHPDIIEKGYDEDSYRNMLENVSSISFQTLFEDHVNGTVSYEGLLIEALDYFGLELIKKLDPSYSKSILGIKTQVNSKGTFVVDIYPGSPSDMGGLRIGDQIMSVNKTQVNKNLDQWLRYFNENKEISLTLSRSQNIKEVLIPTLNRNFYQEYKIQVKKDTDKNQIKALQSWACL